MGLKGAGSSYQLLLPADRRKEPQLGVGRVCAGAVASSFLCLVHVLRMLVAGGGSSDRLASMGSPPNTQRRPSKRSYIALYAIIGASLYAAWTGLNFVQRDRPIAVTTISSYGSDEATDDASGAEGSFNASSLASALTGLARRLGTLVNSAMEHVEPQPTPELDPADTLTLPIFDAVELAGDAGSGAEEALEPPSPETLAPGEGGSELVSRPVASLPSPAAVHPSPHVAGPGGGGAGLSPGSSSAAGEGGDTNGAGSTAAGKAPPPPGRPAAVSRPAGAPLRPAAGSPGDKPAPLSQQQQPPVRSAGAGGSPGVRGAGANSGGAAGGAAPPPSGDGSSSGGGGGKHAAVVIVPAAEEAAMHLARARELFGSLLYTSSDAPPPTAASGGAGSAGPLVSASAQPLPSPERESADVIAERAALGNMQSLLGRVDMQILRDFAPWQSRGIALEDLLRTRSHHSPLISKVANFSSGMITTLIRRGVPYMLEHEVQGPIGSDYGIGSKGKIRAFNEMLASVNRVFPLPDVYFIWNVHPWPLLRTTEPLLTPAQRLDAAPAGTAPILSLCKTDSDLDVLYPNMYFQNPQYWWKATRSLERAARNWPWSRRRTRMWWRGASGWMWPASAPRVLTLAKWHAKPWADLAFTNPWGAQLRDWERAKEPFRHHLPRNVKKIPHGTETRTTMEAVAKYKYSLHLPGSYGATYSRTLQFLVWTGTTIFFYDCPYYEFYYHHLKPWRHFIPVNLTNLGDRVIWAQGNPQKAAAIASNAQRFAAAHLTAGHFALYWRQLLDAYASLQRFRVKLPDDACTCWPLRGQSQAASRPAHIPRGTKRCRFICDFTS